jgi:hypothetical protein
MKQFLLILLLVAFLKIDSVSQPRTFKNYLTVNGNLFYPLRNSGQGVYPILSYDKAADPKLRVGGLGIGFSTFISTSEESKISLKAQTNFSRHVYWDEPANFRDFNNSSLGVYQPSSVDYSLGLTGTGQYNFFDCFYVGIGVGTQILLKSISKAPEFQFSVDSKESYLSNNYYKILMPVAPFEVSYRNEKWLFNIRYEQALLNRYKKELGKYKVGTYGLLTYEVGLRIN